MNRDIDKPQLRGAILSECGLYRYKLWRAWDVDRPWLVFVMLNPSTADADIDDATIRKCMGFAKNLGYGGIVVVNLYAYRATKPADLKAAGYPRGPENELFIADAVRAAALRGGHVVCAWGTNARGKGAAAETLQLLRRLGVKPMALRLTADGIPWHPLYLPYSCELLEMPRPDLSPNMGDLAFAMGYGL